MVNHEVVLLPAAFADLDEIFDYILAENPQAAVTILANIMKSLDHLRTHPNSGSPLFERSLDRFHFRMVVVSPYIAFYRVVDNTVFVYRVLHGARNYTHLLKGKLDEI